MVPWGFPDSYHMDGLRPFTETSDPVYEKKVSRPRMPPDSEVGPRQPLATGRIWLARAVMVQIPEDHQIMIEIVALLGQQSVVAAK